ncbi:MAG: hypothetical protein ACKVRN_16070 [Pyrinomonadaceae bacterium]
MLDLKNISAGVHTPLIRRKFIRIIPDSNGVSNGYRLKSQSDLRCFIENPMRLCRSICGKALLFQDGSQVLAAMPPPAGLGIRPDAMAKSAAAKPQFSLAVNGKAELFRK